MLQASRLHRDRSGRNLMMDNSIARTLSPGRHQDSVDIPRRLTGAARSVGWIALPWVLPALGALLWILGSHYGWISSQILPSPTLVFDTLGNLASTGELWMH